jgi:hypothetical protein
MLAETSDCLVHQELHLGLLFTSCKAIVWRPLVLLIRQCATLPGLLLICDIRSGNRRCFTTTQDELEGLSSL